MNDRMIKLYKEASEFAYQICKEEGRAGGPTDHIWNTLSTGRFAELIVRECADVCYDADYNGPAVSKIVLEHFGVENF